MDGRTDTEDVRLRSLIDILEDCWQFYLTAIPGSSPHTRRLHEEKARCYAAMLAEIRQWQALNDDQAGRMEGAATPSASAVASPGSSAAETYVADDFAALLRRIDRIHHSLFFSTSRPSLERAGARREDASISIDPGLGPEYGEPGPGQSHG